MKRVLGYSSGKDSTALVLWAKEQFPAEDIIVMFNDTLWEHELTYGYLTAMRDDLLAGLRFESLASMGMEKLVEIKSRVPSPKARFCTEELKIKPCIEFLKTINWVLPAVRFAEGETMNYDLLTLLMIDAAGAAEHYVQELDNTEFASAETHKALANLRGAVAKVKAQREYLQQHGEMPGQA